MPFVWTSLLECSYFVAKALRDRKPSNVTGFELLVTVSPFCFLNLREGTEELSLQGDVRDITEVLADAIHRP
jgi:hypothetical protein